MANLLRAKPLKLEQLSILNTRTELSHEEKRELDYLMTGYLGELSFDSILDNFIKETNSIHIKDYRFNTNLSSTNRTTTSQSPEVQIDSLLLTGNSIYTFEVKNYNHDLIYGEEDWAQLNGELLKSPMIQISRQNQELLKLLNNIPDQTKIFSSIVFINPTQTIYNLPFGKNILVFSNLKSFLKRNIKNNRREWGDLLSYFETRRTLKSIYNYKVNINLNTLRPGVFCKECYTALSRESKYRYQCKKCLTTIHTLDVIKRLCEEIKIINPEWPVNAAIISQLSGGQVSKSHINKCFREGLLDY
jgi:hypothetical protein